MIIMPNRGAAGGKENPCKYGDDKNQDLLNELKIGEGK
jgi:hypothetical protein